MKTARFLVGIVALGALTLGQAAGNPSGNHAHDSKPRGYTEPAKAKDSVSADSHTTIAGSQAGSIQTQHELPSQNGLWRLGLDNAAAAPKFGSAMRRNAIRGGQPAQLPIGNPWTGTLSRNVPHRGANAAIIGGWPLPNTRRSPAVITGTNMKRRP
ncbi:MAG: hypothetical protein ACLQUZ_14065 [Rhizomicrobium sp.]